MYEATDGKVALLTAVDGRSSKLPPPWTGLEIRSTGALFTSMPPVGEKSWCDGGREGEGEGEGVGKEEEEEVVKF